MGIKFFRNMTQLIKNIETVREEIEQFEVAKEKVMNVKKEAIRKVDEKAKALILRIKKRVEAKFAREIKKESDNQKLLIKYLEEKEIAIGKLALKQAKNEITEAESELLKQLLI